MSEQPNGQKLYERKRRMSKKLDDADLIPQHFEYENQYDKWRAANPRIEYDFSVDESGYIYWTWTFIVVCGCLYNIIVLSVLAFENIRSSYVERFIPINVTFDVIFFMDILIRSLLSFYDEGVLVTEFSETWRNYVHSIYFGIDLLAIFPFDYLLIRKTSAAFCRLNRFLKVYRIANFIAQSYGKLTQVTISLSKIITACFLLFHVNACVFYIISVNSDTSSWDGVNATFDDDEYLPWPYTPEKITDAYFVGCDGRQDCYNPNFYYDEAREEHLVELYHFWRMNNRTQVFNFSTFTKEYTLSMYWSAMTMTTLGEQPAPNTSIQNAFEIINTLAGLLLFAVIMGSIGDLVANANAVKTYWQTLMDGLKQYMTYRNLNESLQTKVLKYCEYEMGEETIMKEHEVRDELPTKLYGHVTASIIGSSLVKSPLFRISERSFLNDISELLEPHYFCPGDVVIEKGQLCSSMFIIACGEMMEMADDDVIDHYEGEVLGDVNLVWFNNHLNHNRHQHNFVSSAFSQIHMLSRDDFFKVLGNYDPKLKRRLCDVAYYLQKQRGELDDNKRSLVENEDLETNLKRLAIDTLELQDQMAVVEGKFWYNMLSHVAILATFLFGLCLSDYCGSDQIAYGMEVHHSGVIRLLCSKPNCYDKNYSDCPERAESQHGCKKPNEWVGGFDKNIEGDLSIMCCEYEGIEKFAKVRYSDVRIRRGEFFEGEEKENGDGDVVKFDVIKDIRMHRDTEGQAYYNLTVLSFNCESIPDVKPAWLQKSQWPYFQYKKN